MRAHPYKPCICLQSGSGVVSALIKLQTRMEYSHAALWHPSFGLLESREFKGVRVCPNKEIRWDEMTAFVLKESAIAMLQRPKSEAQIWDDATKFIRRRLGLRYDYLSVLRFITRVKPVDDARWFCSEIVYCAMLSAGLPLLEVDHCGVVAPGHIAWSPCLKVSPTLN